MLVVPRLSRMRALMLVAARPEKVRIHKEANATHDRLFLHHIMSPVSAALPKKMHFLWLTHHAPTANQQSNAMGRLSNIAPRFSTLHGGRALLQRRAERERGLAFRR